MRGGFRGGASSGPIIVNAAPAAQSVSISGVFGGDDDEYNNAGISIQTGTTGGSYPVYIGGGNNNNFNNFNNNNGGFRVIREGGRQFGHAGGHQFGHIGGSKFGHFGGSHMGGGRKSGGGAYSGLRPY